jgi:NADH dehydrogenase (ubiquinone) Fe-S protein 6
MLQRSARRLVPVLTRRTVAVRSPYSTQTDNPVPANDTSPKERRSPVSSTNALPVHATGNQDKALVEDPIAGEEKRVAQAPNRETTWSRSQQPRAKAMVGPRFEQTIMEDQVRSHGIVIAYRRSRAYEDRGQPMANTMLSSPGLTQPLT